MWQLVLGGLALGSLSSLHCIGMCGPLALALPVYHLSTAKRWMIILLYNTGRVITYASVGFLLGMAGRRLYLSGLQQWLSIVMGVIILFFLLINYIRHSTLPIPFLNNFYRNIRLRIGNILRSPGGFLSYLWLGMLNGLLPCGMVYIALATALTMTTIAHTVLFMAVFGAGTLPAMMVISYMGFNMNIALRSIFKKVLPYGMAFMGVLLILRGLNLGIPFISPVLPHAPGEEIICHP